MNPATLPRALKSILPQQEENNSRHRALQEKVKTPRKTKATTQRHLKEKLNQRQIHVDRAKKAVYGVGVVESNLLVITRKEKSIDYRRFTLPAAVVRKHDTMGKMK